MNIFADKQKKKENKEKENQKKNKQMRRVKCL